MHDLSGRFALITGAGGDIGTAVAMRLARSGASIALADHPVASSQLADAQKMCQAIGTSPRVEMTIFDVTDELDVGAALDGLTEDFGIPSLVFNNAGVQGEFAAVHLYSASEARRVIEVNVIGAFNVLSATTQRLVEQGIEGSVVNSASMAGVSGAPNMPAYSASKAAVIGLTLSAAKDLAGYGIRVNSISPAFIGPGTMWTGQTKAQAGAGSQYYSEDPEDVANQMMDQIPMRRLGTLDEVAASVLFLLSDDASYLTGVNLEIAGGAR